MRGTLPQRILHVKGSRSESVRLRLVGQCKLKAIKPARLAPRAQRYVLRGAFRNICDGECLEHFFKIALIFLGVLRGAQQAELVNYPRKKPEAITAEQPSGRCGVTKKIHDILPFLRKHGPIRGLRPLGGKGRQA